MKIRSIIGTRLLPIVFTLLATVSCTKEQLIGTGGLPDVPRGMVRMELFTNAENYKLPVTKSFNENIIDLQPWVLVFDEGPNGMFIEAQQATTQGGRTYVILSVTDQPRQLVIIANATTFRIADDEPMVYHFDETLPDLLTGKSFSDVAKLLVTPLPEPVAGISPNEKLQEALYENIPIPMSAVLPVEKIDGSPIGDEVSPVKLQRIVAKVTVDASVASSTFILQGVTVINTPKSSTFIMAGIRDNRNNLFHYNYEEDGTGFIVSEEQISDNNSADAPIYMYESAESTTSILVKGEYRGKTMYYRLAFQKNNLRINVERNHYYTFIISSVTGPGYDTPEQARLAPPSNLINYDLKVVDLSSHDIIDNGAYYLGISNSEFIAYDVFSSGVPDYLTVSILTAHTSYDLSLISESGSEIVSSSDESRLRFIDWEDGFVGEISYGNLRMEFSPAFKTGETVYVTLKLGNLTKVVKVSRRSMLGYGTTTMEFAGGYVAGKIEDQGTSGDNWLTFSLNGTTPVPGSELTLTDPTMSLYLMAKENVSSGTVVRKGGIVYLSRQSASGRLKLYLEQAAYPAGGSADRITWDATNNRYVITNDPTDAGLYF